MSIKVTRKNNYTIHVLDRNNDRSNKNLNTSTNLANDWKNAKNLRNIANKNYTN